MTGILGGKWILNDFHPMGDIPTAVKLTSYSGEAADLTPAQLQDYIDLVENGELEVKTGPTEKKRNGKRPTPGWKRSVGSFRTTRPPKE